MRFLPSDRVRARVGVAAAWLAVILFGAGCSGGSSSGQVGSVLLITIDTLRADHVSCYGYERATTPRLDERAATGVRAEWAFSACSQTAPSHASILTGKYPRFHTVGVHNAKYVLHPGADTLAERCRAAGLRTEAVVSNFVLHRKFGLAQGFDVYEDGFPDRELNREMPEQVAENTTDEAIAALERVRGDRFFAWLHYQDPHGPYDAPSAPDSARFDAKPSGGAEDLRLEIGEKIDGFGAIPPYQVFGEERTLGEYERRYDLEIAYLDEQLGRLFAALEEGGFLEDTLVIVTADHGEAFGEDGFYFAHGHSLGLDQTRVPLVFFGAGVGAGRTISSPVSNVAIFATALEALGIESGPSVEQSESLWAAVHDGAPVDGRTGYANSWAQDVAFRDGLYLRRDRYNRANRPFPAPALPKDVPHGALQPGEQASVLGDAPTDGTPLLDLRAALRVFVNDATVADRTLEPRRIAPDTLSTADQERLRALGYVR